VRPWLADPAGGGYRPGCVTSRDCGSGAILRMMLMRQELDQRTQLAEVSRTLDKKSYSEMDTSFYVYALKDPRRDPALPFYIGKGTGTRSFDHLVRPDETRKGRRISEIRGAGFEVLVTRLVDALTEDQAIRLEAELISAFGTEDSGGLLTNTVLPSGLSQKSRRQVVVPQGARERAQIGLSMLKDSVLEFVKANDAGVTNSDVASLLGLRSDYGGGSKDYLSFSVLGLLIREGKVSRERGSRKHVARVR
jgi:hypothetical protein